MQNDMLAAGAVIGGPVLVMTAALWSARRRSGEDEPGAAGVPRDVIPALALACLPAAWALAFGVPAFPPAQGTDWLVPLAVVGVLAGVAACVRGQAGRVLHGLAIAAGVACLGMIARPLLMREGTRGEAAAWVAGAAIALLAARWSLSKAGREGGALGPLLAWGAFSASSVVVVLTGHIAPALMFGSLAAAVGPAMLLGFLKRSPRLGPGLAGVSVPAAGLWVYTGVLGETPALCNGLAALAVVMTGVSGVMVPGTVRPGLRWPARMALVAVPAIGAMAAAAMNRPSDAW